MSVSPFSQNFRRPSQIVSQTI